MRSKFRLFLTVFTVLLVSIMVLDGCRPRDEVPSDSVVAPMSPDDISAIASPVATLDISHLLLRFRVVFVHPGWFEMGSDPEEDTLARGDETPQHDSTEPGFWIGESEVTNQEYAQCVEAGACTAPSLRDSGPTNHYANPAYDDHPVVGVNWYQASEYCEWIGGRLPTEAEWEKAARGEMNYIFPWGNTTPTCDRTNMNGCEVGDTKPVASYPLGISPYGLYDMAGNVREWTADWYQENIYLTAAYYHPTGAAEGEKKVVRGGGFNDFEENLRTTARLELSPAGDYDDVGFRCVPTTRSYAPFCEPTYTTFCYDPETPPPDEPCEPGEGVPGEEGLTFLGYGCPMNAVVSFQVSTNGGGNQGYTATVDGETFDCQPSSAGDDILNCLGPETPMGTGVQIVVCAPGYSPSDAMDGTQISRSSGFIPVSFSTSGDLSLMAATTANCPDGYILDEATGACVRDETQPECPDGWTYDRKSQLCVPDDPEEDCPERTTYSANLQGCQPDDGECPEGYYLTALRVCEPDQNRQDDCPPGYYYNAEIGCCEPIPPDNYGCEENYYFNANYERCIPMDDNNCPFGTTYNGYGECGQEPGMPGPEDETDDECPPGLLVAAMNCEMPEDGYDEQNPEPGTMVRTGDRLTSQLEIDTGDDGQGNCEDGYTYMANFNRCVEINEDGCPEGYYMDEELKRCRPTNGPGSPCPPGFVFNARLNCCVPEPGMDGTRCPEDEPADAGTPNDPTGAAAGTLASNNTPFANSSFDTLTGLCLDGEPSDGEDGEENPCPPGTFSTNLVNCDQYPEDDVPGTTPSREDCPNYWNPETNTCDYPEPECGEFEYFDRRLGYCVPIQEDCCEAGQDFSAFYEQCVPVVTKPRDGECPEGYELIDGVCWLIDRTLTIGGCWTFDVNTPRCVGPCEVGLQYNELTGRCEEPQQPEDPCADVKCSSDNEKNCPSNCCSWDRKNQRCVSK